MKIRNGFVSNSSSSSFIIIGKGKLNIPKFNKKILNIPEDFGGEIAFGWDTEEYSDFPSRLNWAALGALYKKGDKDKKMYIKAYYEKLECTDAWEEMLINTLKEDFNVEKVNLNFNIETYISGHYIDHQSGPCDSPQNFLFFKNKNSLRHWLYQDNSRIYQQNDNEE